MPRGGKRQGTQGKAYSNRTDLATNYAPGGNPATGGMEQPVPQQVALPAIGADEVPNLNAPTMRPNEPITAGLGIGPGPGVEAMGPMPPRRTDPVRQALETLMMIDPNPDVSRALARLEYEGR